MTDASDHTYINTLIDLKDKIRQARQRAVLTVNAQLLELYWTIGNTILIQQQKAGWGAKVIDKLAKDLKIEFPDMKGLSVRNLKYMRAFAATYPDFMQAMPAQKEKVGDPPSNQIVQVPLAQLPLCFEN